MIVVRRGWLSRLIRGEIDVGGMVANKNGRTPREGLHWYLYSFIAY